MKKYMLVAAILLAFSAYAKADTIGIPEGGDGALATADYGGVEYSTITFSSAGILCSNLPGSVVGFVWSSGTSINDFITFRDTASQIAGAVNGSAATDDYLTANEFARVFYSSQTAFGGAASVSNTMSYYFPKPIRFKRGLVAKMNQVTNAIVTVLYTRFGR